MNINTDYASLAAGNAAVSDISKKADSLKNKDLSGATDEELMQACKDFESYFVEMTMKEVTKNIDFTGGASDSANSTLMDFYKDKTITNLSEQITEGGSLGLAQKMYDQMKAQSRSVSLEEIQQHQAELAGKTETQEQEPTEDITGVMASAQNE
ncbi:MAG: hypothetical protein J5842_01370 [Lachnospiraceae bacterium]|nr:hypothetical protein [Lachnospiraceae bacterium]